MLCVVGRHGLFRMGACCRACLLAKWARCYGVAPDAKLGVERREPTSELQTSAHVLAVYQEGASDGPCMLGSSNDAAPKSWRQRGRWPLRETLLAQVSGAKVNTGGMKHRGDQEAVLIAGKLLPATRWPAEPC